MPAQRTDPMPPQRTGPMPAQRSEPVPPQRTGPVRTAIRRAPNVTNGSPGREQPCKEPHAERSFHLSVGRE
ncbi:DUF1720 domain-containing protein [Micromonospora matsumotoense]|uniref:DUF1720 domain-containing protein n=1 Tax=Micromonospora matsumotoense TaxID=121616 RepID=UPI003D9078C5